MSVPSSPSSCGCFIEDNVNEHLGELKHIVYCPLHALAGEMLTALKELRDGVPRIHKWQFYGRLISRAEKGLKCQS